MWLLDIESKRRLDLLEAAAPVPSAEQIIQMDAAAVGDPSRVLNVVGNKAEIEVSGLLTNAPSFFAMLFGGGNTTYPDITAAIASAVNDEAVEEIIFAIDSPGGTVDGLFDMLKTIAAIEKPTTALIVNNATSAAFALAAQTDRIVAANEAALVGSIGVAVEMSVDENRVAIASRNAPKKRPDVSTPEGVALVQDMLDPMHTLFVEAIARGRSAALGTEVTTEVINETYGEGAVLTARDALAVSMIDEISERIPGASAASASDIKADDAVIGQSNTNKEQGGFMTQDELKAQHPDVYAAVLAKGKEQGATEELDRVTAHLTYGVGMNAMDIAVAAIKAGKEVTPAVVAEYQVAGLAKKDGEDTMTEEEITAKAVADAEVEAKANVEGAEEKVHAKVTENLLAATI